MLISSGSRLPGVHSFVLQLHKPRLPLILLPPSGTTQSDFGTPLPPSAHHLLPSIQRHTLVRNLRIVHLISLPIGYGVFRAGAVRLSAKKQGPNYPDGYIPHGSNYSTPASAQHHTYSDNYFSAAQ
ncbi:hypothetical protein D9756_000035 [Leucocoprinus leucothites]|uniref:Uncharacterized protein n=1 Tax=Leucocoprinus leucothites TaxID=201217 RepID=A0A8H5GEN9_9AGAR|nr:hypothetical protein D9756_000035 [Leucoagaricus leucothites]